MHIAKLNDKPLIEVILKIREMLFFFFLLRCFSHSHAFLKLLLDLWNSYMLHTCIIQ
jgi:hypothetical protein